ncbi:cytochrome c oxidase subunit 3 [Embleya sp. NPDC127516]|uniref:cytochrome c oxidase subunit 3 n=1 Tax=Embleya sp. NPDC127516 TaxID=3363990 RepID=UPI0037F9F137
MRETHIGTDAGVGSRTTSEEGQKVMRHAEKSKYTTAEDSEETRIPHRQPDSDHPTPWIPGELGIWVFVFTDLLMFSTYFGLVMYERGNHRQAFSDGRAQMLTGLGLANTFLLLTASLFIALAVPAVRESAGRRARGLLLGAGSCGALFIVNKGIEWGTEAARGHTPESSIFFQMYYILTGVHLLHVVIAMVVIVLMWRRAALIHETPHAQQLRFFENGATFWHLTDALWIVLFTLFYLVR